MNFPDDWIEPGEFRFCGCGNTLLPRGRLICCKCRHRPRLENYFCHCGKPASMFFVHGFRCSDHAFQNEPSETSISDKLTITVGRLGPSPQVEHWVFPQDRFVEWG